MLKKSDSARQATHQTLIPTAGFFQTNKRSTKNMRQRTTHTTCFTKKRRQGGGCPDLTSLAYRKISDRGDAQRTIQRKEGEFHVVSVVDIEADTVVDIEADIVADIAVVDIADTAPVDTAVAADMTAVAAAASGPSRQVVF